MEQEIGVAEAVEHLRAELAAAAASAGVGPRFEVGPVELEFSVEMRREGTGKAGIRAWVVSADAEVSASKASVHRLKLVLTPQDTTAGQPYRITTDRPDDTEQTLGSRFDR